MERGIGPEPRERSFQLTDVGRDVARDEEGYLVVQWDALQIGLLLENGHPGLDVGRLDVRDEAPLEAVAQPLFEVRDVLRDLVGGEDDLAPQLVEGVERVEELLLRTFAAGEQLHVVEDQDVDPAEALLELPHTVVAKRPDQVVDEGLRRQIADLQSGLRLLDFVADGVRQMRLTEAHAAVDEEGVVVIARLTGHRLRGGMRELVRGSGDEVGERVLRVQLGIERPSIGPAAGKVQEELPLIAWRQLECHLTRADHGRHRLAQLREVVVRDADEHELVRSLQAEVRRREVEWTQARHHLRQLVSADLLGHAFEDASPHRLERGGHRVTNTLVHRC